MSNKMPTQDLPDFRFLWGEDFNTDVPRGQFPQAMASRWWAYPSGTAWRDTSKKGGYDPSIASVEHSVLDIFVHTDPVLGPRVCAPVPILAAGPNPYGKGLLYGRCAVRCRATRLRSYKLAALWWPDPPGTKLGQGEIDFPELNFNGQDLVRAFMHRTGAREHDDQDAFSATVNLEQWHVYETEWRPGKITFSVDGKEIGSSIERVPSTPMHYVFQVETTLDVATPVDPLEAGRVQVDWIAFWTYAPGLRPTTVDVVAPRVKIAYPNDGATVAPNSDVNVKAVVDDNKTVSRVDWFLDGALAQVDPHPAYEFDFRAGPSGTTHRVRALAYDLDGNSADDVIEIVTAGDSISEG